MSTPKNWTPLHLELLLHYHASPEPFPRENSCIIDYRARLMEAGLVASDSDAKASFVITDKGKCYVEMLCSEPLPIPKQIWVDPRVQ